MEQPWSTEQANFPWRDGGSQISDAAHICNTLLSGLSCELRHGNIHQHEKKKKICSLKCSPRTCGMKSLGSLIQCWFVLFLSWNPQFDPELALFWCVCIPTTSPIMPCLTAQLLGKLCTMSRGHSLISNLSLELLSIDHNKSKGRRFYPRHPN